MPADTPELDPGSASRVRADLFVLLGILALAAGLRFVGLDGRGTWDADQGHDMLVLRGFSQFGQVPLLGPPTSIGTFHHGALYYWLLAPAAWLSGSDPVAVTGAIALAGLVTVAATWWLARQIGGPSAGHVAALLTAVSPAAIEQSTFIWNPNLIPAAAALGLAAGWRAWTTRDARWWVGAATGVGVVMQCHILGVILLPPVAALLVADLRRRAAGERAPVVRAAVVGAAVIALMYVPLLVHELTHEFAETRAILAWLASGGEPGPTFLERLPIVAIRVLAWPLAGLVSDRPVLAMLAAILVVVALGWRLLVARGSERTAVRWLSGTLVWSVLALTVAAPSLATIVTGLPNDHYHAFADPVALVLIALAIAGPVRGLGPRMLRDRPARPGIVVAGSLLALALVIEGSAFPQLRAWDGGWPAARASADHVATVAGGRALGLESLPRLKSPDALGFPLTWAGQRVLDVDEWVGDPGDVALVVVCDPRLETLIGRPCNGPAEDAVARDGPTTLLVERFVASPQRIISIYVADG